VCNNHYHDCVTWASDEGSDSCRNNAYFMIYRCSLACEFCHVAEQFHKCRASDPKQSLESFTNISTVYDHLTSKKQAVNLIENSCSTSEANVTSNNDEWVLSINWNELWSDATDPKSSRSELVALLKTKSEWVKAEDGDDHAAVDFDGDSSPDRTGQILKPSQQSEPIFANFISQIANFLQAPQSNLEIEFVHYRNGERYASHKDVRLHDSWKHSGNRVLSMYVALERPKEGGAFGFPSLDWLLVQQPEILVWPNVKSDATSSALERMENEQLPVVDGDLYAAHVWVREYPFDPHNACA